MAINPVEIIIKAKDEASGVFSSMGSKVAAVGASIAAYFGVNAFVGAIKGAAELEAKLSEVAAVSGATTKEMVDLRTAAEAAGSTTKFTATEAADALGNLSRAGLSAKDAITALPPVLQLAQAGGVGLAQASEYVTKTIMGLGLAFEDAGRVADVLAKGANASNTSVDGLAQAMSYAAPLANTLGLSLEMTVAIIGKFADAGIDASRAGTALNSIMAQFSDPASKFRTELAASGITTNNFEQALRELGAAGPAGSKAINAVGTEAGPALRALLNQGIGALDDLKDKLDNAAGSAAKTAAVMEGNLNGAFNGLSSAWDTVKNSLATPVLPVLTSAMQSLSKSFQDAVSSGVIGKFGDSIATAFESGIKWVKAFMAEADLGALATRMQAFAADTQAAFTKIGEYATNAGNIVKTTYGVMSSGVNAVLVVVYGLGEAFAGVASNMQAGLALLLTGLSKITFGGISESFKQAAADVKLSAEATWAASEAFAAKGQKAFEDMADGAVLARDGWTGLTTDAAAATSQAQASTQAFKTVSETLKEVGGDATAAGQKAQAAGILHKEAAESARAAVAQLKTEYEAALAAGNVQLAVEKLQAMQGALKSTGDQAKLTGQDIENAFTRMGVTSSAELAKVRDAALRDYQIIKEAATSTARDKAEAFRVYAEKAIAANNGVATEALKAQASMRGLTIEVDGTGKAIVKAMGDGTDAVRGHRGEVIETMGAYQKLKAAADEATSSIGKLRAAEAAAMRKDGQHLAGGFLEDQAKWADEMADFQKNSSNPEFKAIKGSGGGAQMTERGLFDWAKNAGLGEADALRLAQEAFPGWNASVNRVPMDIGAASSAGPLIKYASAPEKFNKQINELLFQRINERSATKAVGTGSATNQAAGGVNTNSTNRSPAQIQADAANKAAGTTGLTTEEANRIAAQKKLGTSGSPGYTPWPTSTSQTGAEAFASASAANAAASATMPAQQKSYTVNVNIAGKSTAINTSSDADAQALIALLQRAKLSA